MELSQEGIVSINEILMIIHLMYAKIGYDYGSLNAEVSHKWGMIAMQCSFLNLARRVLLIRIHTVPVTVQCHGLRFVASSYILQYVGKAIPLEYIRRDLNH